MRGPVIVTTLGVTAALAIAGFASASGSSSHVAATPRAKATSAATVKTRHGALGTYLVDSKGRTLYLWKADKGSKSTCSGSCAGAWPPLLTKGRPHAAGGASSSRLGTTRRSDGTTEVTYAGHPLYYYAGDTKAGQTTGQGNPGFGAPWYVVSTSGKAITRSTSRGAGSAPAASSSAW